LIYHYETEYIRGSFYANSDEEAKQMVEPHWLLLYRVEKAKYLSGMEDSSVILYERES